jgi:hypothetical protein
MTAAASARIPAAARVRRIIVPVSAVGYGERMGAQRSPAGAGTTSLSGSCGAPGADRR